MVRTQIQMTEEQVRKLKGLALAEHKSIAEIIRQAVDGFISAKPGMDVEERKRRALSAAGRFRSGVKDLSDAHDAYLTGAFGK